MARYVYPAVFAKEKDGSYSIHFPDIKGCYSQGNDIIDGMCMAEDALSLMMYQLEKDGAEIPKPTNIREISLEKDCFATYITCDTKVYSSKGENNEHISCMYNKNNDNRWC